MILPPIAFSALTIYSGKSNLKGRLSTVNPLVLTSLDQLFCIEDIVYLIKVHYTLTRWQCLFWEEQDTAFCFKINRFFGEDPFLLRKNVPIEFFSENKHFIG